MVALGDADIDEDNNGTVSLSVSSLQLGPIATGSVLIGSFGTTMPVLGSTTNADDTWSIDWSGPGTASLVQDSGEWYLKIEFGPGDLDLNGDLSGTITLAPPVDSDVDLGTLTATLQQDPDGGGALPAIDVASDDGTVTVNAIADTNSVDAVDLFGKLVGFAIGENKDTGNPTLFGVGLQGQETVPLAEVTTSSNSDFEGLALNPGGTFLFTIEQSGNDSELWIIENDTGYPVILGDGTGAPPTIGDKGDAGIVIKDATTAYVVVNGNIYTLTPNGDGDFSNPYGTTTPGSATDFTVSGTGSPVALDSDVGALGIAPDGTIYGIEQSGTANNLRIVDPTDGSTTLVVNLTPIVTAFTGGSNPDLQGMSFDSTGQLWVMDRNTGDLFQIDLDAGEVVGSVTVPNELQTGDGFENVAVGFQAADAGLDSGEFVNMNVTATFNGDFRDGSERHYLYVAIPAGWMAPAVLPAGYEFVNTNGDLNGDAVNDIPAGDYLRITIDQAELIAASGGGTTATVIKGVTLLSPHVTSNTNVDVDVYTVSQETLTGDTETDDGDNVSTDDQTAVVNLLAANVVPGGTAGNNVLNGTADNDIIDGGAGNDTLNGLAGRDLLIGGEGNDILNGGLDGDILIGGPGVDTMYANTSGTPADTSPDIFRYESTTLVDFQAEAGDTIHGFDTGSPSVAGDVLDLNDVLTALGADIGNVYLKSAGGGSNTIVAVDTDGDGNTGTGTQVDVATLVGVAWSQTDLVGSNLEDNVVAPAS